MRPNLRAGAVFIWPWQSAPNITRASGYLLNRAVFFVLLLVLTSLLFKKPFHVQFKPSRVSKTTMHCVYNDQAEVVCQFTANSTPGWSCLPIQLQPGCTTTLSATVDHVTSKYPVIRIERKKSLGKKFKIKSFASGFGEIWDSRSIEGKDKLSTDSLTVILSTVNFCLADTPL